MWLRLFNSCTGCQSLRGSSTSCAAGSQVTSETCRNTPQTLWHWLLIFQVDLHYMPHCEATLLCHGRVDEYVTEPSLLLHREHGTGCRWSWNCCNWRTRFIVIWKHFCLIMFMGPRIWIDSVMRPRSSSRGAIKVLNYTEGTKWLQCIHLNTRKSTWNKYNFSIGSKPNISYNCGTGVHTEWFNSTVF